MDSADKRPITPLSALAWIALTAGGYLANVANVPLFFNVDFLFGSVFALIVLHYYGWGPGLVSALIIASHTAVLWSHPYSVIVFALEIGLVGLFYRRRSYNLVLLDTLYWVIVGMPLIVLFYGGVMNVAVESTILVVFKQAINGIINALLASIVISVVQHLFPRMDGSNERAPFAFSQAIFLLMVAFVLVPGMIILVVSARSEMARVESDVASKLEITAFSTRQAINAWIDENLETLGSLANVGNLREPGALESLRDEMELLNTSDGDFQAMALIDVFGGVVAGAPREVAEQRLADARLAQWPYFTRMTTGMMGVASNVIDRGEDSLVILGVPIGDRESMAGAVLGIVESQRLREELFRLSGRWMLDATILDGSNRVIASTHTSVRRFQGFDHLVPHPTEHQWGNIYLRMPAADEGTSFMQRWQRSEYIAHQRVGMNSAWSILLQAPIAPYQDALNDRYTSMLLVMLLVVVGTVLLSSLISSRMLSALTRLTRVTNNLPEKVTTREEIDWPTSRIQEIHTLIHSFTVTSDHLGDSFHRLQEANRELSIAKQEAEAASRTKSEFLANISHDLRTPLNGILGYAQILVRDETLDDQTREAVSIIEKSGNHLLNLISDILDVSRIEAKRMSLEPEPLRLPGFLDDLADIVTLQARIKGLRLETMFAADLPEAVVADEKRLRQVLLNLLTNAVKFTSEGTIRFLVSREAGGIRFEVEDTGPGIPAEQQEEIFSPFRQLGRHIRTEDGTGLGLAIVQRLVQLMGGTVSVESALGEGSRFWFVVDLPETSELPAPAAPSSTIEGYEGERKRVLVVDDKWENRSVARGMLEPLGFEVVEAEDGRAGVQAARSNAPDLVLMDLVMPVMDGFDAIREIRANWDSAELPVIAVSASVADTIRAECLRVGFSEFLAKPFKQADLLEAVRGATGVVWVLGERHASVSREEIAPATIPADVLERISTQVQAGNIRRIVEAADELLNEPAYAPVGGQIVRFAQQFRINELSDYLDRIRGAVEAHE